MREVFRYIFIDAMVVETVLVNQQKHAPAAGHAAIAAMILLAASIAAPTLKLLGAPHLWLTGPVYLALAALFGWCFFLGIGILLSLLLAVATAFWAGMFNSAIVIAAYPHKADESDLEVLRTLVPRGRRSR